MTFNAINTMWILLAAFLVFFMQVGFGMVEAGLVRTKNAANIIMKNLLDFASRRSDILFSATPSCMAEQAFSLVRRAGFSSARNRPSMVCLSRLYGFSRRSSRERQRRSLPVRSRNA